LPYIKESKSLPIIPQTKDFNLRLNNLIIPPYDPNKDKYLQNYFEKQIRHRQHSESFKVRKSIKTMPSVE